MNKSINKILKDALEGENISYLTKKLKLPKGFLHRLVKEDRSPSLNNIDALTTLAEYLGISLEMLLTGKDKGQVVSNIQFEDSGRKYSIKIERLK